MSQLLILLAGATASGVTGVMLGIPPLGGVIFGLGVFTGMLTERVHWLDEIKKLRRLYR